MIWLKEWIKNYLLIPIGSLIQFFLIKRANKYFPQIEKILIDEDVPLDFKYLALIESGLKM